MMTHRDNIAANRTRDPERIDEMIEELRVVWKTVPDYRLTQLVLNIATLDPPSGKIKGDPFYVEDIEFLEKLKWLFNQET